MSYQEEMMRKVQADLANGRRAADEEARKRMSAQQREAYDAELARQRR